MIILKNNKKQISILVSIFVLLIFSIINTPQNCVAEEWIFEEVDTEMIPEFSVYPSEHYTWIYLDGSFYGNFMLIKITKANLTDEYNHFSMLNFLMGENGTSIWGEQWLGNVSTGEAQLLYKNIQLVYWNKSIGYRAANTLFIPLEEDSTISEETFINATENWEISFFPIMGANFEHFTTYSNSLSCKYWNDTYNEAYFAANYTNDGVLRDLETYSVPTIPINITLSSKPSQLPPDFDIITETGEFLFENKSIMINVTINDIDSNNDQITDDDYLYRMYLDDQWTDWTTPVEKINWTLSEDLAGNCTLIIEIRNMYGTTQKEITIEYDPHEPNGGSPLIPGYSLIAIIFSISTGLITLLLRNKKKYSCD